MYLKFFSIHYLKVNINNRIHNEPIHNTLSWFTSYALSIHMSSHDLSHGLQSSRVQDYCQHFSLQELFIDTRQWGTWQAPFTTWTIDNFRDYLGGDEFQTIDLPLFLLFDDGHQFRIILLQTLSPSP